jgi:7,8-dihydropterin-6-yl-methyl-4-(beta-D-ribofuranosyl)aminobenzene 5'-phosphate synthase
MRISIIYDNTAYLQECIADWGFSCYIEHPYAPTVLFDTGSSGEILMSNMKQLHIDPLSIQMVFISHGHFDHVGGLAHFLKHNSEVSVYLPESCSGGKQTEQIVSVSDPLPIGKYLFSTGELGNIEQSLAVQTEKGIVLIVGCSHPNMQDILHAASQFGQIYAIVGGMHGFRQFELFQGLEAICPTHCTQHIQEIRSLYPQAYIQGGAGRVIEL